MLFKQSRISDQETLKGKQEFHTVEINQIETLMQP